MLVRQVMITDVVSVHEDDLISVVLKKMIDHRIGIIPVLDSKDRLSGVITDGDIMRTLLPKQMTVYDWYSLIASVKVEITRGHLEDLLNKKVSKLMRKRNILTVTVERDLGDVLRMLSHHHLKRVPVIDREHHVVGLIGRSDVLRYLGEQVLGEV